MGLFDFLKNKAKQPDHSKEEQVAGFSAGDVFYINASGKFNLYKLLVDDKEFVIWAIIKMQKNNLK